QHQGAQVRDPAAHQLALAHLVTNEELELAGARRLAVHPDLVDGDVGPGEVVPAVGEVDVAQVSDPLTVDEEAADPPPSSQRLVEMREVRPAHGTSITLRGAGVS